MKNNSYDSQRDCIDSYHNGPLHSSLETVEKPANDRLSPAATVPVSPTISTTSSGLQQGRRQRNVLYFDNRDVTSHVGDEDDDDDDDDDDARFEDYASNICFLVGSILYVWLAVWDIIEDNDDTGDDDSDDDEDDDPPIADDHFLDQFAIFTLLERRFKALGILRFLMSLSPYVLVSVCAAWCYVVDAGFQIAKLICHNKPATGTTYSVPMPESQIGFQHPEYGSTNRIVHRNHHQTYYFHNHGHVEFSDLDSVPGNKGFWRRQKCFTAALVGLTFGAGAAFDMAGGFIVDSNETLSDMLSMIACHIYLVNALLTTFPIFTSCSISKCRRMRFSCHCHGDKLEYIGDLLFLLGSAIDVLLSYWNMEFTGLNLVLYGYLLSALLWLIDAIFYIAADYIGYEDEEEDDDDDGSANGSRRRTSQENEADMFLESESQIL